MKLPALLSLAAAAVFLAACSSSPASSSSQPAASQTTTAAAAAASATAAASPAAAAKTIDGNITVAPAGSMAPGPMKITPVSCGNLSDAQQTQFGTTAAAGFVYRFSNDSNTLVAAPKISVNFTSGSAVVGANVTGDPSPVSPGQSGTGEVDAVGNSGQDLTFTGCQVMWYALVTSSGVDPSTFAG